MRILITTGIFPPDIGGPATQIERLAADLQNSGFEITVLTYGKPIKKERNFKLYCVSRKWLPGIRHLIFEIKNFWLAKKADVIYTIDLYSPGFYSMKAAKFWRKKLVVRFAGDSAWESAVNLGMTEDNIWVFQEKEYNAFVERLKRRRTKILGSANSIVAVSNFIKELAIKIGIDEKKIQVIYNAVDFFKNLPQRQKPEVPTLVFAGRLTPWKGVSMLIEAVAGLKQKYPNLVFEILGDGSEMPKLEKLARDLAVEENVKFRGKVSEEASHKIFARSSIFVLNTNYEGLPHSVLNAMQIGLPVITTPVGGNKEVVQNEENGLLVDYNDKVGWQRAIEKLLDDEMLQEKFIANAKKTLSKFKWSDLIEKTAEVFHELA